jgi:hypothetical protein
MRISSLISTKVGRLVVTTTALSLVAPAIFLAGTAQARSVRCDAAGRCTTYCTQTLSDGAVVEYGEGTNITITTTDGHEYHYTCKNGYWVKSARTVQVSGMVNLASAAATTR